jgi:serine/threonine-protein kinase
VIGPYEPAEVLGEGAAAVVYRAVAADGTEVALKVLRAEVVRDEHARSRLEHEIRAVREIRHPNVVPLLDAGEADGVSYIAFEYVAGSETLARRLEREGALPAAETVAIALQVASALDAVHAAGIVHRDVKPSNVILAGERALLSDFGLVRGTAYTALTRPGRVLGTADYMAPELIRGTPANAASDLYALGCTVYECAAGSPPFGGRSMLAVGIAHLEEEPPHPAGLRPELSAAFGEALLAPLAKDPAERPPTASAYAEALQAAL